MLNQRATEYLRGRNIDPDLAARRGLFSATRPDGEDSADEKSGLLAIPYYRGDAVVNVKFRKLWELKEGEDAWLAKKGGKLIFWNRAAINDPGLQEEPLIITEGEWDALAAIQAGFQRVVSVPNGASEHAGTKAHKYVDEAWEDLKKVKWIILATDGDEAGYALREDLLARLGRARCKSVTYPKGCKDLGDALRVYGDRGIQAVKLTIEKAKLVPMDGLYELHDLPEEPPLDPLKLRSFGEEFRHHIGICRGQVSMWTGEPGGGKTTLVRALSWAAAVERGWKTCAAFFEDKPRRDTVKNLKRLYANGWPEVTRAREAEDWIAEHYKFILKKDGLPTVDWYLDQADAAVIRYGCDLIIADPWSQFDLGVSRDNSPTEAVLQNILKFRNFAEAHDVHVAIIAHPKKHGQWGGTSQIADGDAIAGSFHFRARCDLGVTVQADPRAKFLTNVKVWKVRDREDQGDIGEFPLILSPNSKRFSPPDPLDLAALRATKDDDKVVKLQRRERADIHG